MQEKNLMQDLLETGKQLMFRHPFYGFFLSSLNKEVIYEDDPKAKQLQTAAVGRNPTSYNYNLYINADFWSRLSSEEKIAIVQHEVQHILYHHPIMAKTYAEKELFNVAAD